MTATLDAGSAAETLHTTPPPSRSASAFASLPWAVRWEGRLIALILAVAALNGLIHVFLIPPWQHYDEPGHFEYVWMVAHRLKIPEPWTEYDRALERDVIGSMVEHDFYVGISPPPEVLSDAGRIWLPMPQTHDPPLYPILATGLVYWVRHTDVVTQLYAARLASWLLYLLTVWVGYRIVAELTSKGHPLRIAVPGTMALLPAFVDLMTAVNNDVAATAMLTLFLWGGVRWLVRGENLWRFLWITGSAVLCAFTKNTAAIAVPFLGLLWVAAPLRRRWHLWYLAVPLVIGIPALAVLFGWGDAAAWYRYTDQVLPLRQQMAEAPLGRHALALEAQANEPSRRVVQFLLPEQVEALRGRPVTLGGWMWASRPVQVRSPEIGEAWQPVALDTVPRFVAFQTTLPADLTWAAVTLQPVPTSDADGPVVVYYDGLVLAEGSRPVDEPPSFDTAEARAGTWGSAPFVNAIRNASMERGAPWLRPAVMRWLQPRPLFLPPGAQHMVAALFDWERTAWVYPVTARRLLTTFWAVFRWGGLMLDRWWYSLLTWVTVLGLIGAGVRLLRPSRHARRAAGLSWALLFLGLVAVLSWSLAMLRALPLYPWEKPFIPAARYTYPTIVPTVLTLTAGWTAWPKRSWQWWSLAVWVVGLVVLNVASLQRIVEVFYP